MRALVLCALFAGCLVRSSSAATSYEAERQEVKKLLAADFSALNRGEKTLADIGERVMALVETAASDLRRRILLDGAIRLFARAGETNRADAARVRLNEMTRPFAVSGRAAVLRLGKYGKLEFVKCPTGTVDVAVVTRRRS